MRALRYQFTNFVLHKTKVGFCRPRQSLTFILIAYLLKNKFYITLFVVVLLSPATMLARGVDPLNSSFFSVGFGVNSYANHSYGLLDKVDMQAQLTMGKWLFKSVGVRFAFTELHATNTMGINAFYESGEFNVIINPREIFRPRIEDRLLNLYAYFGVGVVHRHNNAYLSSDNDFMGTVGISLEQRLAGSFFLHGDISAHIYPPNFDANTSTSVVAMAIAGFTYKMHYNPYHFTSPGESQRLREDWYVGGALSGGVWARLSNFSISDQVYSGGVDLVMGKHFSTVWDWHVRMSLYNNFADASFLHYNANIDLMANVTNIFSEQRNRPWNLEPYIGLGIMDNLASEESFLFNLTGGLFVRRWLTVKSDIYLDARITAVPSRFCPANSPFNATLSLGYIYNIGRNTCR